MAKSNDEYLTGKCLISMPNMEDERFAESLIYICSHNQEGAMGFVVNKKLHGVSFADLASQLSIKKNEASEDIDLHQGGPLEKIRGFVLHSPDYVKEDTVVIDDLVAISSSIDVITDIAFGLGPRENLIALGYASWSPKQLEAEIMNNAWLVTEPSIDLIFRTKDEDKWQKAITELGIDIGRISKQTGHA